MMQPTQPLMREEVSRGYGAASTVWCFLPESKMGAILVVIANVFRQQAFEMSLIQRNCVIQQISTAAFNATLGNTVLPRTFERHTQGIHG